MTDIVSGTVPTLLDVVRRQNPDESIATIVEILEEQNGINKDAVYLEGNLPTGHRSTVRSGLPTATWRKLNYGVAPDKSGTVQIEDTCGMLEAYAEVDKALVDLSGDPRAFRLSEDIAFLEAMNQQMAHQLIYGNTLGSPERFLGLHYRYDDTSAENGNQIVIADSAGTSHETSIWLVGWGPQSCFMVYPRGSKGGFQRRDLGEVTLTDGSAGRFQGYRTHYKWDLGLVVRDYRQIARICNIPGDELVGDAATGPDLTDLMIQAMGKIWNLNQGRFVFYVPRPHYTYLRRQMVGKSNRMITDEKDWAGKPVMAFGGIPVRIVDALATGANDTSILTTPATGQSEGAIS